MFFLVGNFHIPKGNHRFRGSFIWMGDEICKFPFFFSHDFWGVQLWAERVGQWTAFGEEGDLGPVYGFQPMPER